ncbi:E3 ubiquitin-protein ligase SIAH1A-like [Aethina tumida]|uniref:E3 ubiquitin-protein ligase SIAH1A-like n=1 Tax=Aethina tumida TaxID=116153 RepID=UPI002148DB9F|nr:E3 ubiquitin-protein ligase SIAH1A-like [Aethina tumida]
MAESNNRELISCFECPVCYNYAHPPLRPCVSGHIFCNDCWAKVSNCPMCRERKSSARDLVLESIHGKLTFPCKFASAGCMVTRKGDVLKAHEQKCMFSGRRRYIVMLERIRGLLKDRFW